MVNLSLNDIQYMIEEASKMVLNEITVKDAYTKYYSDIPINIFRSINYIIQGDNDILLPETKWALNLYKKKSPRFMEDLYKLKNNKGEGYLDIFNRAKERKMISGAQADLNQYKSIAELGKFVGSLDVETILGRTKGEMSNAVHEAKDDVKKIYEDDEWLVLIPKTHEASCYWGSEHWCTANRDDNSYFEDYTSDGPLYMNINKKDKTLSTQFHFESEQFMDYNDEDIDKPIFNHMPRSKGLRDFYEKHLKPEQFIELQCYNLNAPNGNRYSYYTESGVYMVDAKFKQIAGPYEHITIFSLQNKLAQVRSIFDGSYNLIDESGNELLDECDLILFDNACGVVYKAHGKFFILHNGESIYLENVKSVLKEDLSHIKIIMNDNSVNLLDTNLNKIFPQNYKNIKAISKDFYIVTDFKGGTNVFKDGKPITDEWFASVAPISYAFNNVVFKVYTKNFKINFIDTEGNRQLKNDVLEFQYTPMGNNNAGVITTENGEKMYIDKDFNLKQYSNESINKLTVDDIKFIINETTKKLITEIKVVDAYSTYYKDIPEDVFQQIVTVIQGSNDILLPNTKWYLGMYKRNPEEAMNYLPDLRTETKKGLLDAYERGILRGIVNGKEANLANFKTLQQWGNFVVSLFDNNDLYNRTKGEWSKAVNDAKNDIEIAYEDDKWIVIIPKSMDASCYWGSGTQWCTATRNEENNQFENYASRGDLYININKQTKEKYQFHLADEQFMDANDEAIEIPVLETIEASNGLIQFYSKLAEGDDNLIFKLKCGEIRDDDWYYNEALQESVAVVYMKGKGYNYYTYSGSFVSDKWFTNCYAPDDYIPIAKVYDNGYNLINLNTGDLEFPNFNFDDIYEFTILQDLGISYAVARKDMKSTLLIYVNNDSSKYLTWFYKWFDYLDVSEIESGYVTVKTNGQWAYVDLDGNVIGDTYEGIWDVANSYFKVEHKGKYNYVSIETGDEVSDTWFDDCDDEINDDYNTNVEIDGQTYQFNVETGEII